MMSAAPALAQGALDSPQSEFIVDVSDPNVSIDLSVLDDGSVSAHTGQLGAITVSPTQGGESLYQAPGADAPVSTLYIQPAEPFTLPPQTKTLIAEPATEAEPDSTVAEDIPSEPELQPEESLTEGTPETMPESVAEAMPEAQPETVAAPAAPEPAPPAPQETAKTEPQPEPAPQAAPESAPEKPEAAPQVAAPAPAPAPAPTPAKPVETVVAEPAPMPAQPPAAAPATPPAPVAETPKVEAMPEAAPMPPSPPAANAGLTPPPPQALSKAPGETSPSVDETQTAPKATPAAPSSGAVVVDLPPKLEETHSGVASLPPATGTLTDGDNLRIVFENDSSKLPSDAREALKNLSDRMAKQTELRLQLLAYAGNADTSASAARRLSLSRALAVRSYLIESGVRSTRIDVRALGNKSTETVTERVDITVVER